MSLDDLKGKTVDDVIDEIKKLHGGPLKICYPKQVLTNDHNPARLAINCDVHGRILSFTYG